MVSPPRSPTSRESARDGLPGKLRDPLEAAERRNLAERGVPVRLSIALQGLGARLSRAWRSACWHVGGSTLPGVRVQHDGAVADAHTPSASTRGVSSPTTRPRWSSSASRSGSRGLARTPRSSERPSRRSRSVAEQCSPAVVRLECRTDMNLDAAYFEAARGVPPEDARISGRCSARRSAEDHGVGTPRRYTVRPQGCVCHVVQLGQRLDSGVSGTDKHEPGALPGGPGSIEARSSWRRTWLRSAIASARCSKPIRAAQRRLSETFRRGYQRDDGPLVPISSSPASDPTATALRSGSWFSTWPRTTRRAGTSRRSGTTHVTWLERPRGPLRAGAGCERR